VAQYPEVFSCDEFVCKDTDVYAQFMRTVHKVSK